MSPCTKNCSLNTSTNLTEDGLRTNISATLQYTIAWLNGNGAVGIGYDPEETTIYTQRFMEDLATAEISRSQLWQWLKHKKELFNGIQITSEYYRKIMGEELNKIKNLYGEEIYNSKNFNKASEMFLNMISGEKFDDFLTLPAYKHI